MRHGKQSVYLIDDHPLMHKGIKSFVFGTEFELIGSATDVTCAEEIYQLTPDHLLLDLDLPSQQSFVFMKQLAKDLPEVKIIVFSSSREPYSILKAVRLGASAFVTKLDDSECLLHAMRSDDLYFSPRITDIVDRKSRQRPLTDRQKAICKLLVSGKSSVEIARELDLSPKTVQIHKQLILRKLHLKNDIELARFAVLNGQAMWS